MEKSKLHRPWVVFVHGAGGGGWEWDIWCRVFAAHGWGMTAADLMPVAAGLTATRLGDYVDQVVDWMSPAQRGGETRGTGDANRVVLIGASLGGLLALLAAARSRASAMVLVNPLPPQDVPWSGRSVDYPDVVPWRSRGSLGATMAALPDADAAARLFAFRHWRDESGGVLRETVDARAEAPSCPLLVLGSQGDSEVDVAVSQALAQRYGGEFRLLAEASHVGPLLGGAAARIAEEAQAWLQRVLAC